MDFLPCPRSWINFLCTSSAVYQFSNVTHVLKPSLNYEWLRKIPVEFAFPKNRILCSGNEPPIVEEPRHHAGAWPSEQSLFLLSRDTTQQQAAFLPVWWCCLLPGGRWPGECSHETLGHWMHSWWGQWPGWRHPPCRGGTEPQPGSSHPCLWSWTQSLPLGRWNTVIIHNQTIYCILTMYQHFMHSTGSRY